MERCTCDNTRQTDAPTENLTAVLHGIEDIRLENRPIPEPGDYDVQLRMETVGICGSDVHYLTKGAIGHFVLTSPMVIGHEASGTVSKLGGKVTNLKVGDRVAIEPGQPCRMCNYCKDGRYNLCLDMKFCATPPYDGNLARYYVHPADFCYRLPENVSLDEGALLEPLSVGVHGCKRGGVKIGSVVVVMGAGPIGLVTLLTAKAFGASKVLISDMVGNRLELAKKLGADHTLLLSKSDTDESIAERILVELGRQPDVSIDCCGAEIAVRTAVKVTASGGVVVLIGMGGDEMTLPLAGALIREVDIRGVFRYVNDYQDALEMVASGRVNVKPLITHHFKMEETIEAFDTAKSGKGDPVKILIHANPNWKQ